QLYRALPARSFGMPVTAGIFYTVGLVFCSLRKIKYFHAVGDVLMLFASIYLFFSFLHFFA
ncbi:MAG: hypothetical protein K2H09_10725, partial [Treponemataceae bacterium]|nr:hypothetical protein [Treponemataceae bacterium]